MRIPRGWFALAGCLAASVSLADESQLHLKEAPETPVVVASCSICHSIDYIEMNSVFMKRATWQAEVHKMVKVMGAPISDADQATVIAYLSREYGVAD
jgi:hypothetical protein